MSCPIVASRSSHTVYSVPVMVQIWTGTLLVVDSSGSRKVVEKPEQVEEARLSFETELISPLGGIVVPELMEAA